jgi:hypothetical protein
MSAATKDVNLVRRDTRLKSYPMAATVILFAGTFCCLSASGYAVDGADTDGLTFVGIVDEGVDNSDGANGDENVSLYSEGEFLVTGSGFARTDVGKTVFLIDNQTVGLANAASVDNQIPVGEIVEYVSSTQVWVRIKTPGQKGDKGELHFYEVEVGGTNAAAISLATAAADYGGADFYVRKVIDVDAIVTGTGAAAAVQRKVLTTHFTLASGVITTVGNETANTWRIRFVGHLL